ncbi:hypothetical protein yruck0001_25810 [Yersinia ruckeri ATCC 29473]|nr:hypothetical protein yruck0001_25810 [Yersinia ruckeri ATCC 29473]
MDSFAEFCTRLHRLSLLNIRTLPAMPKKLPQIKICLQQVN